MKTRWWDDVAPELNGEPVVIYMPAFFDLSTLDERFPRGRRIDFEKHAVWLPPR